MHRDDTRNKIDFDSLTEMASWLTDNPTSYGKKADRNFYGETSWDMAMGFAAFGDDRNVPSAQKLLTTLETELPIHTTTYEPSVAGCYPVVAEYLNGEPECMRDQGTELSDSSPLSIYVDLTCSAGINADDMRKRGIAALALTMALSAIRPISLHVCAVVGASKRSENMRRGDRYGIVTCRIETSPLDLTRAAFALTDVACVRRLFYGTSEILHDYNGQWPEFADVPYGEASSEPYMKHVRGLLNIEGEVLYLPPVSMYDADFRQMIHQPVDWINSKLAQLTGIEAA